MTNSNTKNAAYHLSGEVLARIVQIVQEAIITGTDIGDLLYEMELTQDDKNQARLKFTDQYKAIIEKSHADLLKRAEELKQEAALNSLTAPAFDGWNSND